MVQTMKALVIRHAPEAEPVRSAHTEARIHSVTGDVQAVSVDTRNTAAPVVPDRAGVGERAVVVVAAAGGGEEEGGWGGSAVGLNFIAAGAGSSRK